MRYVVLDTETTGLDPKQGHRLIEIGAVEVIERCVTGQTFHHYINPEREIDEDAKKVHGIDEAFLADKPRFADIVEDFWRFCEGSELVIHNASFDMGFINHELAQLDRPPLDTVCTVLDTLKEARQRYPGKRNNLDALCERLGVDASHRELHGALLDAQLLAEVFLAMTRGQQSLIDDSMGTSVLPSSSPLAGLTVQAAAVKLEVKVLKAKEDEEAAHQDYLKGIKEPLWQTV